MKVKSMIAALLLMAAGVQTAWGQKMVVTMSDDSKVVYDISQVKDITFEEHEWVDLGLPSGTLWATCNVGASSPEEYGDYFAWGETEPKDEYGWSTYKWCNGTWDSLTKYCQQSDYGYNGFIDNLTELLPEDDAATANWGSGWQMPSLEQIQELCNSSYTTIERITVNGAYGWLITSRSNGNSIFLPTPGYRYDSSLYGAGRDSYIWSRSLKAGYSFSAYILYKGLSSVEAHPLRYLGRSVRPVRVLENDDGSDGTVNGHAYVEIGGLKWATMNVGATTVAGSYETCFGDYFAWGETEPRYTTITRSSTLNATFTWRNGYSSGYSSDNYPTYTGTTLDSLHDAATANWGGTWRTPTRADFKALAQACSGSSDFLQTVTLTSTITEGGIYLLSATQTYEPEYTGVVGVLFVDKEDIHNRVFFPTSGYVYGTPLHYGGTEGHYWSSTLYTSNNNCAYSLYYKSSCVDPSYYNFNRFFGFPVRPVSD